MVVTHKDAPDNSANQTHGRLISRIVLRNSCLLILLVGATVGMLVGILNFLAMNNRWTIQDDFFDIVDAPVNSLMPPVLLNGVRLPRGFLAWRPLSSNVYSFRVALVIICYWTIIGLLLASLICLVRGGVVREITRDKICRYILFSGSCGGGFIGSLSFLAASDGWEDTNHCFYTLNQPVYSAVYALQVRYGILDALPPGPQKGFICWHTAAVVYWTVIGLLVALICCVIRILKKRKAARVTSVSGE